MAYTQIFDVQCTDARDFFQRLRDFICKRNGTYDYSTTGIGWTLHDSVYASSQNTLTANDYIVLYSPGESGRDQLYVKITYVSTVSINSVSYLYWNNVTHVGTIMYDSLRAMAIAATPKLAVYGDLNSVSIFNSNITSSQIILFGKLQSFDSSVVSETVAFSTTDLTAGVDKNIILDVDLPSDWAVNKNLFIWDNSHIEQINIKTINTGTRTITANLVYAYTGVIKVSRFCGYYHTNVNSYIGLLISQLGTLNIACTAATYFSNQLVVLDGQKWTLSNYFVITASGMEGKIRNMKNYSLTTPLVVKDILTDTSGVSWRCCQITATASITYLALKEVA